jgi:hypothetical protein
MVELKDRIRELEENSIYSARLRRNGGKEESMRNTIIAGFLATLWFCFSAGVSRGMEPYDDVAMPQGSYFSMYPLYYHADRLMDKNGNAVAANPEAALYQNTFKYNYYDKTLLPNTALFSALLPVGCIEMLGSHDCGVGDLTLVGGYWFVDDPESKTWFGVRAQVVAPIGSYDKNSKANMGANVWKFRPILYAAKQIGNFQAELTAKYTIYTKNADTDTRQGNEATAEGYVGYFLKPDLLLGGHLNGTFGQDKTVSGAKVPDSGVLIWQAGASVFKNFGGGFSALIEALSDFGVKNSTEGYTVLARLSWKL